MLKESRAKFFVPSEALEFAMFAIQFLQKVLEALILPVLLVLAVAICFERAIEKPAHGSVSAPVEAICPAPAKPAPAKSKFFGLVPPPPPLEVLLGQ